jgi:hypothetical protein
MTVAEGGGKRAVQRKFQDIYVPALKANWLVWPTVQMINFRVMPIQYQIVRVAHSYVLMSLISFSAFCLHRWYRMDSIPFSHEFRRRSNTSLNNTRLSLYILGPSAFQVGLGPGLVWWSTFWLSCAARSCIMVWQFGVQALYGAWSIDLVSGNEFQYCLYPSLGSERILSLSTSTFCCLLDICHGILSWRAIELRDRGI